MDVTWHSFDFATGRRGPEVITQRKGAVSRIIGEATDTTLPVLCYDPSQDPDAWLNEPTTAGTVPGWDAATTPGLSMLVALDENEHIEWGGFVLRRVDTDSQWVDVTVATCEAYLDRRYTGDLQLVQTDQALILRELLEAADETHFDVTLTGVVRDALYQDFLDQTISSGVLELFEAEDGPEFTCDLEWTDATRTALKRVWRIGSRLGRSSAMSFTKPGSITSYTFTEDFSSDHGANVILATGPGEGDMRPTSDVQEDVRPGWRRFEKRYPAPVDTIARLNAHARATLPRMRDGLAELTFEAHLDNAPRVGVDFHLGDDVQVSITSARFPAHVDPDGATLPGLVKRMRMVGYTADYDTNRLVPKTREVV